jgi:CRP-like cAMP-binding protein
MSKKKSQPFDPEKFLLSITVGKVAVNYPKGSNIFTQGKAADAVFYIQKGNVKLAVVSEEGKEVIIGLLTAGDFIGAASMLGNLLRLTSATAIRECALLRIEKEVMLGALRDQPEFSQFFAVHVLSRNTRYEEDLVHRLFDSSEQRLARTLMLLTRVGKEDHQETIILQMNQETLAQMVGTTRSRVSHFMNKFRKLGLIDYNGGLKVHSSLQAVVLHRTKAR